MKKQRGFTLIEGGGILIFLLKIIVMVGWVWNIIKLVGTEIPVTEFGAIEILRIVGIILFPLGTVMGFL